MDAEERDNSVLHNNEVDQKLISNRNPNFEDWSKTFAETKMTVTKQTDLNPNFEGWPKTFAETDAAVLSLSWSQRLLCG